MEGLGSVTWVKNDPNVRQVVTTSEGKEVIIPSALGVETYVEPCNDGTYAVKEKNVTPGSEWKTTILTEKQLEARYGANTGNKLQAVA